ncbi:MAG: DUF1778 domain-containing protein [Desulfamplus sp.]|nr:DUF1778 domain-containing protein [Desulfamplus sp.]
MIPKKERLNVRMTEAQKRMINRAAKAAHSSVSEFVVSAVCRVSEQILSDQTSFFLNEEDYLAFTEALERPAECNPVLERILNEQAPWEE